MEWTRKGDFGAFRRTGVKEGWGDGGLGGTAKGTPGHSAPYGGGEETPCHALFDGKVAVGIYYFGCKFLWKESERRK